MATAQSKYSLAPIQSSYVDPGTVQSAQILRQRYDQNKSKYDMINRAAENLKVGGGDQHLKDSALQGIQDGISRTASSNNFEAGGGVIDDLATDFATNEGLQVATESYNKREAELAYQAEMTAKGMQFLDFNAIRDENGSVTGHAFDTHQSYWTDENGKVHKDVYSNGVETQLDYSRKMQQLIGTIAKSGSGLSRLKGDFAGLLQYNQGVSQSKADKVAEGLFGAYLESDEGVQQMRKLTEIDGLTAQEASSEIISQMRDVASPQVGMVRNWMKDPNFSAGASSIGSGNSMVAPGGALKDGGADSFATLTGNIAEFQQMYRDAPEGSPQQEAYRIQMMDATNKYSQALQHAAETGNADVQAGAKELQSLFAGDNNRFAVLQPLLDSTTTDEWFSHWGDDTVANIYNPFSSSSAGSYSAFEPTLGMSGEVPFYNVSDALTFEGTERDNLKAMFSDYEALNAAYGTNYTAADVKDLAKLADKYYTYMDDGYGEDVRSHIKDTIQIKTDDRVVFSPEGKPELAKVNGALGQLKVQDFQFFNDDGSPVSADQLGKLQVELDEASKNNKLNFDGLIMPNMWTGTQPSMMLDMAGVRYRAIPNATNSTIYGHPIMQNVATQLGLGNIYAQNNVQVDRMQAGEMPNSEAMNRYMQYYSLSDSMDAEGNIINVGLVNRPGFSDALQNGTVTDWAIENNLPPQGVMQSATVLRELEATMLQEVGAIAGNRFTAQELSNLNLDIGSPEDIAMFDKAMEIWNGMSFNAN